MPAIKLPKKLKTILMFTIIGLVVAVLIYFIFTFYLRIKQPVLNAYLAVPEQAVAIIEVNQTLTFWDLVLKHSSLWKNIQNIDTKNDKFIFAESFLSSINANAEIKSNINAQKLIISFQENENNQLAPIFIVEFNEHSSEKKAWNFFTSLAGEGKTEIKIERKTVVKS